MPSVVMAVSLWSHAEAEATPDPLEVWCSARPTLPVVGSCQEAIRNGSLEEPFCDWARQQSTPGDHDGDGLTDAYECKQPTHRATRPDPLPNRIEYQPRESLSLVRGGAVGHHFSLRPTFDVALFPLALAGTQVLHPRRGSSTVFSRREERDIVFFLMQTAPTFVILETEKGSGLRNLGRTFVRWESVLTGRTATLALGRALCDQSDPFQRADCRHHWGQAGGVASSLTSWATTLVKSRRRRGLAFDIESLLAIVTSTGLSWAGVCGTHELLRSDNEDPFALGPCTGATLTGAAIGVLIPALHHRGR